MATTRKTKRSEGDCDVKCITSSRPISKKQRKNQGNQPVKGSPPRHSCVPKHAMWNAAARFKKGTFKDAHWDIDNCQDEDMNDMKSSLEALCSLIESAPELMVPHCEPNKAQRTCAYRVLSLMFNLRDREPLPGELVALVRKRFPKPEDAECTGFRD